MTSGRGFDSPRLHQTSAGPFGGRLRLVRGGNPCCWQRRPRTAWHDALAYCENLDLGGHDDWRLPNVKELQSIVNYGVQPSGVARVQHRVCSGVHSADL